MKRLIGFFAFFIFFIIACTANPTSPLSDIQTPPGTVPELFAPGIVSTENHEGSLIVTPDGKEICYVVFLHTEGITQIYCMRYTDNQWSEPILLPISGQYEDAYLAIHPDGSRLYFQSNRPIDSSISLYEYNIWYSDRIGNSWAEPKPMGRPINGLGNLSGPSVTSDGTIYFTLMVGRSNDLYRSEYINGEYQEPERLPDAVNAVYQQFDSYIAPDESFLLFCAYERDDSYGGVDLFISFRDEDGRWSQSVNLGPDINSSEHEGSATITPDGRYIFYTRYNNGNLDIFWVNTDFIRSLR